MDLQPGAALADQLRHVGVKQGDALESEIVLREKLRDLAFNNPAPSWMEGSAKVAKRAPKLVLTDEQKLQRQTKHIGRILRAAILLVLRPRVLALSGGRLVHASVRTPPSQPEGTPRPALLQRQARDDRVESV